MLEQENANLRRRVAVAAQKKEEVKKKVLFANRSAEVLLDQFNTVAAEVERVHTRPPCEEVNLEPEKELVAEKERVQMANIELEREITSGDNEIKTL